MYSDSGDVELYLVHLKHFYFVEESFDKVEYSRICRLRGIRYANNFTQHYEIFG